MNAEESREYPSSIDTVVLDLDGTLVDSVYQHVVAWRWAFLRVGIDAAAWRIHRAIGLGGDRLVTEVAGAAAETAVGADIRTLHAARFEELLPQVTSTQGASDLLQAVRQRGLKAVVATSGEEEIAERMLSLVGAEESLHAWVAAAPAEESKPAADLLDLALDKVEGESAIVVGDTTWDVKTAATRSFPCIGLRTGGISEAALRDAGAVAVFDTPGHLADLFDETLRHLSAAQRQLSLSSSS